MKKITLIALMLFTALGYAQVGINTNNPDASSALEIESTTGGILIPRLTETQRDAISAPATGLMIYQTDQTAGFYFYDGNIWTKIDGVAGPQGEAGADGAPGLPGADGTDGVDGAPGLPGADGTDGVDGNSSRWKYSEFGNGPFMGAGYFTTGTGFFGLSVNQQTEKDQVNAIRINKTDDNTVTPNLTDWLLFCDIGSLIYIRKVNQVDEVAYYSVTARVDSFNGAQEVKYIVNYVDGDDSPGTFADDEEYYIGFINTSTNSPANAVRFLGIGIADTAPPSTETNPGKFSLTVPSVNTSPIPSWNDANGIVISGEDINNTPIQKWIQGIRENDIVTISQRGNPTNFSHYKMTGTFSELPVNTGVWAGGFQSQGINQYSIAYDSQGIATPYDGSTPPEIPSGWIIEKHPNHVYIDPATGPVIDTGYNSSYTINYEYEISYSNAGIDGAGGADGTDGVDGAPGLPGADGTDGIDGAPGLPGPQGPPGATGPIGPIGERGFDGNSSVWQYNATPTSGQFRLFGVPANIQLAVSQSDAYGDDLDNWLVFAEPGDIITIRDKNDPNNVGYFQLTQPFAMGIGPPPVIFTTQNLIYIDSTPTIDFVSVFPATLFTLIDDCYIGYVKTGTDGPAGSAGPQGPDGDCGLDGNSSVWKLDNAATGGEFDTSSAPTTFNLINQIKINYFDAFGVDMENWILDAQPGDHVTIRERCVFSNYGIYELTSSTVGPGQQSWILNFISGSALSITLNTEYIIGYTQIGPTGPVGPRGPDGTDGIDGVDGLAGAPGLPGAAGADGIDGAQGPIGLTGSDGIDGIDGATGPSGANGANGSAGVQGAQGEAGSQGIQGIQGDIGLTGATGPSGANGANGAQGPQGEPASVMDQGYVNGVNCSIPGATAYNSDVGDNVVCKPYLIIDGTEQFLITNELTCADNSEGTSTNIEYWISFEVSQPLITYLLTFEPFANNSFCGNVSNDFKEIYKVESSLFNSGTNLGEMIFSGSAIPKFVLNPGNTYTIRVAGFDNQVSRTTSISNYSVNSNLFSNVKFYTTTPNSFVLNETFDQWALLYNFGNSFLDGNILTVFSNWELRWQEF